MTEIPRLTPELLLQAYAIGVFPMSESRDDPEIFWVDPRMRGILPLSSFHISRSLARTIRSKRFTISFNRSFDAVVNGCADRPETWINEPISQLYADLHHMGHAHSIEVWSGDQLVGGVYGVTLGGAFFGESMFSRQTDASKVALAYLTHHLALRGFTLFDTQFITPHLQSLGAIEITKDDYKSKLAKALVVEATFTPADTVPPPQDVIQRNAQTS